MFLGRIWGFSSAGVMWPKKEELVTNPGSQHICIVIACLYLITGQDEEEEEEAFNQKHALQKAKEVGPMSSFKSSE